jgi:hypothetical protein
VIERYSWNVMDGSQSAVEWVAGRGQGQVLARGRFWDRPHLPETHPRAVAAAGVNRDEPRRARGYRGRPIFCHQRPIVRAANVAVS